MAKPTSPSTVASILAAKDLEVSAQSVAELYDLAPETVRRIWRGETHRKVKRHDNTEAGADESLARLTKALSGEAKEENDDSRIAA